MKQITEYLLSKNHTKLKGIDEEKYNDLVGKLYNKLGRDYYEFIDIKDKGIFQYVDACELEEVRLHFPQKIIDIADINKDTRNGETIYTWSLKDVIEFYDYDYDKTYDMILDWFDYLQ